MIESNLKNSLMFLSFILWSMNVSPKAAADIFETGGVAYDINIFQGKFIIVPELVENKLRILSLDLQEVLTIENVATPHSIAVDGDRFMYVGGHRSGRIFKFDADLKEIPDWDQPIRQNKLIDAAVAVAVDPEGNVYIADWVQQKVIKVNDKAEHLLTFDISQLDRKQFKPHGIWVDGAAVYVASYSDAGAIHLFTEKGEYIKSWPRPNPGFSPMSIRPLSRDYFAAPNKTDNQIYIFNKDGEFLKSMDYSGSQPGTVSGPSSLVADDRGHVYFSYYKIQQIEKVSRQPLLKGL